MKENKVTRENSSQISQKHTNSLAVAWQPIKEVQKKNQSNSCGLGGRTRTLTKSNYSIIVVNNIAFSLEMFTPKAKVEKSLTPCVIKTAN